MERSIAKSSWSGISCHHLSMLCIFTFYTNNNRSSSAIPLYWLIKNFHSTIRMYFCPQKMVSEEPHPRSQDVQSKKKFITTIQINLCPNSSFTRNQHKTELLLLEFFAIDQPSQPLLGRHLDFTTFSPCGHLVQEGCKTGLYPFLQYEWLLLSRFHFFFQFTGFGN